MDKGWLAAAAALSMFLSAASGDADAKVTKFEVLRSEPAFGGRSFGVVGSYEKIIARATIGVDPADRHNASIVDIERAPRNASGLVEAVSEVIILRPAEEAKANRRLFFELVNRGRILALGLLNDAPPATDLLKEGEAGNGFLMTRGYTLVWAGWQGDLRSSERMPALTLPVVPDTVGISREEFVFDNTTNPISATLTYPTAALDPSQATLTVRNRESDTPATPADLRFTFESPTKILITRPAGFDAGALYEFTYKAKDPKPMGLAFAAVRDVVSFLRNEKADSLGAANPLTRTNFEHAVAFGISQSGRVLRDFLYHGFNEDEAGRVVFEGLIPHIAGGKKSFVNYRFGQPGRNVQQHADHAFPGDQFPFTYPVLTDHITGKTDGILAMCQATNNCPKVIHTDTELEFFQSRASLVATDTKGNAIALPENVRTYHMSSAPHFSPPSIRARPAPICEQLINPIHVGGPMRALLSAMDEWIKADTPPPASRYPSPADQTLVSPEDDVAGFPAIPAFTYTGLINRLTFVDHSAMPPKLGEPYPVFVPTRDADGHNLAGIRLPAIDAPEATLLGFNYRKSGFSQGQLCDNFGSALPFATTREERLATKDPRPSLAERYPQPGDYEKAVAKSALGLVAARLLLEEDANLIIAGAKSSQ
jgi:Alpha/beta hydrolase domain